MDGLPAHTAPPADLGEVGVVQLFQLGEYGVDVVVEPVALLDGLVVLLYELVEAFLEAPQPIPGN